jgi:predicted RNase H-like nuclease (RuvC/YqgF family)
MAQTAEQRKISRLESEVKRLKAERDTLKSNLREQDRALMYERNWRMDFQRLMKAAAQEDTLNDYDRNYF